MSFPEVSLRFPCPVPAASGAPSPRGRGGGSRDEQSPVPGRTPQPRLRGRFCVPGLCFHGSLPGGTSAEGASPGDGLGAEWAAGLGTGQGWGCWGTWAWRMWGRSRTLDSHFNPLLQFSFQTAASLLCWWDYSPLPTPALSCVPLAMEELFQPVSPKI